MRLPSPSLRPTRRMQQVAAPALLATLLVASALPASAPATASVPRAASHCHTAAEHAARVTGVPLAVLRAIALAETGRRQGGVLLPWPWAINAGGDGRWLGSRAEAAEFLHARLAEGRRNIDVGCFQINYRWHGAAFPSAEAMLDPKANALHAARFLRRLYAEAGDWHVVAGLYHSRTPALAERYRARVRKLMADTRAAPRPDGGPAPLSGLPGHLLLQLHDEPVRPLLSSVSPAAGAGLFATSRTAGAGTGPALPRGSLFAPSGAPAGPPIVDLAEGRRR